MPVTRVGDIIHGRRGISADSALRLAVYFGTTPEFWLNLKKLFELRQAEAKVGVEVKLLPTLSATKVKVRSDQRRAA